MSGPDRSEAQRDLVALSRVAVVKPDFGATGGFERHVDGLLAGLKGRGWNITLVQIDGITRPRRLFGQPIDPSQLRLDDEFFLHMALVERTQRLDLERFDLVLTTQPPTYLADHPRKVALFYHQARQFYDLAPAFMTSGFVDREVHTEACRAVRTLEREAVDDVRFWLAGSAESAARLGRYWHVPDDRIALHAAPPTSVPVEVAPYRPGGPVVCIGRQEWPKRTELLVQAMHLIEAPRVAHLVGAGSRMDFVRSLDARLHHDPAAARRPFDDSVWLNRGIYTPGWRPFDGRPSGRIEFEEQVSDERRDQLYDEAMVVVAPAFREDYGLTAIEAMIRARPVIVCRDGGGLTEFIDDGETGLIVDPDPVALAAAIDRLAADPDLAAGLGKAARDAVLDVTMDRAVTQVEDTFLTVLADD